jgi:hypothetical protein
MNEVSNEEKVELVMRQTNYDSQTAQEKLTLHSQNVTQVIREYLNIGKKPPPPCTTRLSVNQQIYKEIRGMMDDAAKTYLETKQT